MALQDETYTIPKVDTKMPSQEAPKPQTSAPKEPPKPSVGKMPKGFGEGTTKPGFGVSDLPGYVAPEGSKERKKFEKTSLSAPKMTKTLDPTEKKMGMSPFEAKVAQNIRSEVDKQTRIARSMGLSDEDISKYLNKSAIEKEAYEKARNFYDEQGKPLPLEQRQQNYAKSLKEGRERASELGRQKLEQDRLLTQSQKEAQQAQKRANLSAFAEGVRKGLGFIDPNEFAKEEERINQIKDPVERSKARRDLEQRKRIYNVRRAKKFVDAPLNAFKRIV